MRCPVELSQQIKQAFFDFIDQNYKLPNYLLISNNTFKSLLKEQSGFITTTPMDTGIEEMKFLGFEVRVEPYEDILFTWKISNF